MPRSKCEGAREALQQQDPGAELRLGAGAEQLEHQVDQVVLPGPLGVQEACREGSAFQKEKPCVCRRRQPWNRQGSPVVGSNLGSLCRGQGIKPKSWGAE